MVFTEQQDPKTTMAQHLPRIIFVALLHVLVFFMIAQSMGIRSISKALEHQVDVVPIPEVVPTPPPTPPIEDNFKPQEQVVKLPYVPPPVIPNDAPPDGPVIRGQHDDPKVQPTHTPKGTPTPTLPPVLAKHEPVRIKAVIEAAACSRPEYPKNSARNEEQGTVLLGFLVGTDGRVIDSRIEKSSGHKDLDKAARQGLSLCKFKPGTVDGLPQESWASLQYEWKLE